MSATRQSKRARTHPSLSPQQDPTPDPIPDPNSGVVPVSEMSVSWKSKKSRVQPCSSRDREPSLDPEPDPNPNPAGNPCEVELQDEDFPHIKFRDIEHFSRFKCLKVRRIVATRFISDECITALGIKSDLEWLFDRVGWRMLMMNQHRTFAELTLEFLSSFQQNTVKIPKGQVPGVRFRMFNQEFDKTLDEFGDFYGLPRGGSVMYYNSDPSLIWRQITGCSDYYPQSAKASRIHNPVFRYLQRLMASTIFGRHDSQGTVREWEVEMIQTMLYPPDVHLSTASYIARHFHAVGRSKKKSPIVIGGLITPIAISLGFALDQIQSVGPIPTLDIPKLVVMRWLHEDGDRYRWIVDKKPTFFLPNPDLTTVRNQANWEFSKTLETDGEEERNDENYERENQTNPSPLFIHDGHAGGSPFKPTPRPSPRPCDFAALQASLDSIRTGIQDIHTSQQYMNQRLDHFDQMLYPIYSWHVQQGHINPNTLPYPDPHYPQPHDQAPCPPRN
ncbi:hypothetical protein BVRB_1g014150 [Beta vulgaris subsp. vulgaris]|uniref:uncharacterized protein LOC104900936 n=1 Tax=Beta vulgaris subsp. vulgaris TaxID=3555 RepID=UPI00053F9D64|nr:uncharacterized protein LOC104900936 [Beta vulgaris subsp. vulgaris]KMT19233.1 hypothetical protein BVRB_1g014150 [Beta vulgaris subsp. vulgaris]